MNFNEFGYDKLHSSHRRDWDEDSDFERQGRAQRKWSKDDEDDFDDDEFDDDDENGDEENEDDDEFDFEDTI